MSKLITINVNNIILLFYVFVLTGCSVVSAGASVVGAAVSVGTTAVGAVVDAGAATVRAVGGVVSSDNPDRKEGK